MTNGSQPAYLGKWCLAWQFLDILQTVWRGLSWTLSCTPDLVRPTTLIVLQLSTLHREASSGAGGSFTAPRPLEFGGWHHGLNSPSK